MHPLRNGSQVTARPARKATAGTPGYFSESNDNSQPSYPGQDWFNDVIDEFKNALAAANIAYLPGDLTHLAQLFAKASEQYQVYNPATVYSYGDVVYKTIGGVKKFFQWYSNVESLAGKDPELDGNRQTGWIDDTKPFYWTPLKGSRPGTPLWPWMSMTFPEGTLNVVGNSVPKAVFWRLAEAFPEFINGDYIDFPETGGEFFRVLDQGRGIDVGRTFNSYQKATITAWNTGSDEAVYSLNLTQSSSGLSVIGADQMDTAEYQPANLVGIVSSGAISLPGTVNGGYAGSVRPRNLAFPILVEV
ncbi:hypothetical protein [Vibrio fluvialis]|uniref:hypothetical protein n=1 Tax=Vibrio fluvialis TaxID=676 RepID=UPI001F465335|nr:hypothetical protein [Vibrio fluvialis]MCE7641102.1 hypothetical protein [Vibrio fluvialis]